MMTMIALSQLAIDWLTANAPAIIEAWYPGIYGGEAVANALFGKNRFGKTPFTIYREAIIDEFDMINFDMSTGVGRSYRYDT